MHLPRIAQNKIRLHAGAKFARVLCFYPMNRAALRLDWLTIPFGLRRITLGLRASCKSQSKRKSAVGPNRGTNKSSPIFVTRSQANEGGFRDEDQRRENEPKRRGAIGQSALTCSLYKSFDKRAVMLTGHSHLIRRIKIASYWTRSNETANVSDPDNQILITIPHAARSLEQDG